MTKKSISADARNIMALVAFAGIVGFFMLMYFLFYIPHQKEEYSKRTFRTLKQIADNFTTRIDNYPVFLQSKYQPYDNTLDSAFTNLTFSKSFQGYKYLNVKHASRLSVKEEGNELSLDIHLSNPTKDTSVKFRSLFEPWILVYRNSFEELLVTKDSFDNGGIALYKKLNISSFTPDTILKNKIIAGAGVLDIELEGIAYKLFTYPFKINTNGSHGRTYLISGFIKKSDYRAATQDIPIEYFVWLTLLVLLLLLSLPFLKLFYLGRNENITVINVRSAVTVFFILPFVITVIILVLLEQTTINRATNRQLAFLDSNIQVNFKDEIQLITRQLRAYDNIFPKASSIKANTVKKGRSKKKQTGNNIDYKDSLFYPHIYKNIDGIHWTDGAGDDIVSWNFFRRRPAGYFKLQSRNYYRDIRAGRLLSFDGKDSFVIEPVLSKLTGEYSINIAIPSRITIQNPNYNSKDSLLNSLLLDLTSRMYSVYNTTMPKDFSYCIINDTGLALFHSDTARCLQENLLTEMDDPELLRSVMRHKTTEILSNVILYNQAVKMHVSPVSGLPYYLVVYMQKRGPDLFVRHTTSFTIVCGSFNLLIISIFSYLIFLLNRQPSKLFYTPGIIDWIKYAPHKRPYYKTLIIFLGITFALATTTYLCMLLPGINEINRHEYIFNMSMLLPLFSVTGYYIIRILNTGANDNNNARLRLLPSMQKTFYVLLLYSLTVVLLWFIKSAVVRSSHCNFNWGSCIMIILLPFIAIWTAQQEFSRDNKSNSRFKIQVGSLNVFIISILCSCAMIGVLPVIGFMQYAFCEEKKLQVKSYQMDLAENIQERRNLLNRRFRQSKLSTFSFSKEEDNLHKNTLKFKKGIYSYSGTQIIDTAFRENSNKNEACPKIYKAISNLLFLPKDHLEYFENTPGSNLYFYWEERDTASAVKSSKENSTKAATDAASFTLRYKNTTDFKDTISIAILSTIPRSFSFINPLYFDWGHWGLVFIFFILIAALYHVSLSLSKRLFLVDYFEHPIENNIAHADFLKKIYIPDPVKNLLLKDTNLTGDYLLSLNQVVERENNHIPLKDNEQILKLYIILTDVYEEVWNKCDNNEQFLLYDLASDGFTNYKNVDILYKLYKKGLISRHAYKEYNRNQTVEIMSHSFRAFLLTKSSAESIRNMDPKARKGPFSNLQLIIYLVLIGIAIFIVVTQEDASKRLVSIIGSIATLIPTMLKLLSSSPNANPDEERRK